MAFSSGGHHPGWSLKQGRMVAVANHFLKNGVPKVNVSLQAAADEWDPAEHGNKDYYPAEPEGTQPKEFIGHGGFRKRIGI